jgi:hypothetical protein
MVQTRLVHFLQTTDLSNFYNTAYTSPLAVLNITTTRLRGDSSLEFPTEHSLQGLTILGKLFDTFMKFIECHLLLKKRPAEFGLIVNVGNLRDGVCLCSGLCVQPPGDRISAVSELLEERGRDSEEVNARECLDLTNLQEIHVNCVKSRGGS